MFPLYRKIIARSLDFVPIIGPFFMLAGYIKGYDLVSKIHFKRLSRKGRGFLGCGIFTTIGNIFLLGEALDAAGYIVFPFSLHTTAVITLLVMIASYICYAIFLGVDLFQGVEARLIRKTPLGRYFGKK